MPRSEPSSVDKELIRDLARIGVTVSHAQLERWRTFGIMPRNHREHLGRGRGSKSAPHPSALHIAEAISKRAAPKRPIEEITLRVFLESVEIRFSESAVKASLEWYVRRQMSRTSHGKAAAEMEKFPSLTDDAEDAVAEHIIEYYARLPPRIREALPPGQADWATAAILGLESIGADRLVEILDGIDPRHEMNDILLFRAAALRRQESDNGLSKFNYHFSADHQITLINDSSHDHICSTRKLLWRVAGNTKILNMLRKEVPDEEPVRRVLETFEDMYVTQILLRMYSPSPGPILNWKVDSKNLIMLLAEGQMRRVWITIQEIFEQHFEPHLEELVDKLEGKRS